MPSSISHWHWRLAGLLLAALTACHPVEPYQTERFDFSAAPAAAEGYPMEVVEGSFRVVFLPRFLKLRPEPAVFVAGSVWPAWAL